MLVIHHEHERHADAGRERHLLDDVEQAALRRLAGVAFHVARADHVRDRDAAAGELVEPSSGPPGDHAEDDRGGPAVDVAGNRLEQIPLVEDRRIEHPDVDGDPHQVEHRDDRGDREHEQQQHQSGVAPRAVLLLEEIHLRPLTLTLRLRERE